MDKITDLLDRLERVRIMRANAPDPDALSVSLCQLGAEMNALDDDGMEALTQELTEGEDAVLTSEEAKEFINSFRR